ncbi:hypothetical protein PBAC_32000 [Pedobacter glucosidilyticus]|nr:hypothetical protein [Pedobacter glucosidilyticus]KHJ36611.1 hypothetical protein PBAC_32000 [Pedobacter glucosidilyticus]
MKNLIAYFAVFYTITLSSCEKSENLKDNCYQAKVLSNVSGCGTVVQIVAGSPRLPNSIWIGNEGEKNQKSYSVKYLPSDYTVGKTIYLQVNDVSEMPSTFMPAVCGPLPDYYLDIDLVDENCVIIEASEAL